MAAEQIRVDDVVVGERARKDYGDLDSLMDSIREHGILQPIGLAPGDHLLFGGRRLEAARRLGMSVITVTRPATQTDALSLLKAERDENTCRKEMTPEELVDVGMRVEELEREKGRAAMADAGRVGAEARWGMGSARVEQTPSPAPHDTNKEVADALGITTPTYRRMKTVVRAARDEDTQPEVREAAQSALAKMNAGEMTPSRAETMVREARNGDDARKKRPAEPQRPPAPPRYGGNRRKHLQVIQSMTTALDGLTIAADEITELDNSVTQEEAAQLVGDLSRQIRSLNQIRNLLKERTR